MHGLPWIHKSIEFRKWDVHFAQTWFLWCMHLIWASRPCKKLCHTIVRSIESYWRPAAKKSQGSLLVLKSKVRGDPGFCRTSTTRKLGFFSDPSLHQGADGHRQPWRIFFFKMMQLDSTKSTKHETTKPEFQTRLLDSYLETQNVSTSKVTITRHYSWWYTKYIRATQMIQKKCLVPWHALTKIYPFKKKNTLTKGQAPETLAEQSEPVSRARPIAKPK